MNIESGYIIIRCLDCPIYPCSVKCNQKAIAYFHGNIMIKTDLCAVCKRRGGEALPRCVVECAKSGEKMILEELGMEEKRKNAANTLSW